MTQQASDLINSHEALIQAVEAQQAAAEALLQDGQSQQQVRVYSNIKYQIVCMSRTVEGVDTVELVAIVYTLQRDYCALFSGDGRVARRRRRCPRHRHQSRREGREDSTRGTRDAENTQRYFIHALSLKLVTVAKTVVT